MRIDDWGIRGAMDRRLSALDASPVRRARIRQRIHQEEEVVVKKKLTVGMALAIALLLALAGVALAAGLNLFEAFGQSDARLAEIAPRAVLVTEAPETVESSELGTTVAAINSAYYDGESLLVAYSIENGARTERFTPTEAQLSQMTKLDAAPFIVEQGDVVDPILDEFNQAQKSGTPYGITRYYVYPSDHTKTGEGLDLPPTQEMEKSSPEGGQYMLREYESPLPEGARNRDSLNIRIPLYQSAVSLYFDGKDCYQLAAEPKEAGVMTATVPRTGAKARHYVGEGTYGGEAVRVKADASAVRAAVTVSADADLFSELPEDSWYELVVRDTAGNPLRMTRCGAADARTLEAAFESTGTLPDGLTIYILVASEGEWDEAAALAAATPIHLTMEK